MKKATSIEQQIDKLKGYGLLFHDEQKAKEILLDIGYYRIGFYIFPFEERYPLLKKRDHKLRENTYFDEVVKLYYFDNDLRHLLLKYICRIEINVRTFITYTLCNEYPDSPTWFIDPEVVKKSFISDFDFKVYNTIKKNPVIQRHHKKYVNDKYAPAWKTIEFMTLGNICTLFQNIKDEDIKLTISRKYGLDTLATFESYLSALNVIRNLCAHSNHVFDLKLNKPIKKGRLIFNSPEQGSNIYGVMSVIVYFLEAISQNRADDLKDALVILVNDFDNKLVVKDVVDFCTVACTVEK
ncbi:MAG: Abi family protein [Bacteroidales bacterium]